MLNWDSETNYFFKCKDTVTEWRKWIFEVNYGDWFDYDNDFNSIYNSIRLTSAKNSAYYKFAFNIIPNNFTINYKKAV